VRKAATYIAILGVVLAVVSAAAGAVAARRLGTAAYQASAVAAFLNWIAGSLALVTVVLARHKPWRLHGALLASMARMALPLAAIVVLTSMRHPLTAHGVAGLIVVHYLVGLTVETLMSVRLVAAETKPAALTSNSRPRSSDS
jgi:hypothetical protein